MLTAKEAAAEMFRAVRDARLQRDTLLMMADDLERAIVDRPAPTPTPAPGLDLDAVELAERAMTPGEWRADFTYVTAAGGPVATCIGPDAEHDAAGIVALRNAASALIAEVRRLRAQVDADRRAYLDVCDAIAPETSGPADAAAKARATRKERDDLRAKLATAKRLGMEACDLADEATGSASEAPDCAEQVADYRERERAIRLSIGKV